MKIPKLSNIGFGAALLASSSLLSRALGVLRDLLFAHFFGTQSGVAELDINTYFAAFKIPDLIYTLLVFGALSAAFIPIYTRLKRSNRESADDFATTLLNQLFVMLLVGSIFLWVAAPFLMRVLVPGFSREPLEVTIKLTRIMLLSPFFFTLSSVFQGIENAHKRFLGIALAPIMYNLGIIGATIFFAEDYGVFALAWGAVAGAFLHFLVQIPGAFRAGYRYRLFFPRLTQEVRDFFRLSLPRILGMSVTQLSVLVDTFLASLISGSALAVYTYAGNLQSIAYGVLGLSISIAVFANLSEQADGQKKEFIGTLSRATNTLIFWVFPVMCGIFLLSDQIVELLLNRGAFDYESFVATSFTLKVFIWAALGQSFIPLFARAFYARHNTKTPVLIALFSISVAIGNNFILTQIYGFGVWALALSVVISSSLNMLLLIIFLARDLKCKVWDFFSGRVLLTSTLYSALMFVFVAFLKGSVQINLLLEIVIFSASGATLYFALHTLTKTTPYLQKTQ